ncbi:HSP20 family molecular chaperone IbpA [Arthrobacter sp. W4I7]|nr:HSP20 family molecular chaperone IbpA [Arthrobacter sp. W4I7]
MKATYRDGVLEVRAPLPEQGTPEGCRIPIIRS